MLLCGVMLVLVTVVLVTAPPLSCRDQDGAAVDWFVLYKLPAIRDTGVQFVGDGVSFLHFSSASAGERWTLSAVPINASHSAAGLTLRPLYQHPTRKSLIYVFYNNEKPDGSVTGTKGHTKGVVAFNGDHGFWLVHSVPHFPPPPWRGYDYPATGHRYGQSFLCLTLPSSQMDTVAEQLLFNDPHLYATQMSSSLESQYPVMARVIAGERRSEAPWFSVKPLSTVGGQPFVAYAKAGAFGKDLYSDLVAPSLQTGLLTETWMNGAQSDRLPSDCSLSYPVFNVRHISVTLKRPPSATDRISLKIRSRISFEFRSMIRFTFSSKEDHSKWAVSQDVSRPWVCVGDINRMMTQERRGGGTVCHLSPMVWRVYSQLVAQVEPCPARWLVNVSNVKS